MLHAHRANEHGGALVNQRSQRLVVPAKTVRTRFRTDEHPAVIQKNGQGMATLQLVAAESNTHVRAMRVVGREVDEQRSALCSEGRRGKCAESQRPNNQQPGDEFHRYALSILDAMQMVSHERQHQAGHSSW